MRRARGVGGVARQWAGAETKMSARAGGGCEAPRAPQSFISKHPQMPMLQVRPAIAIVLATSWEGHPAADRDSRMEDAMKFAAACAKRSRSANFRAMAGRGPLLSSPFAIPLSNLTCRRPHRHDGLCERLVGGEDPLTRIPLRAVRLIEVVPPMQRAKLNLPLALAEVASHPPQVAHRSDRKDLKGRARCDRVGILNARGTRAWARVQGRLERVSESERV